MLLSLCRFLNLPAAETQLIDITTFHQILHYINMQCNALCTNAIYSPPVTLLLLLLLLLLLYLLSIRRK